jgi:hypothetical protein
MGTSVLIALVAWLITVPLVLGAGRLLGRATAPRPVAGEGATADRAPANVVALVPRPKNDLVRGGERRRAA